MLSITVITRRRRRVTYKFAFRIVKRIVKSRAQVVVPGALGLVLGLLVINSGEIQHEDVIAQAVVVTVTLSLVLHSVTARPGIRWLSGRGPARAPNSAGD